MDKFIEAKKSADQIDAHYATAHYNRACYFSMLFGLDGDEKKKEQSIISLQIATKMNEELRERAVEDEDFEAIKKDKEFGQTIS